MLNAFLVNDKVTDYHIVICRRFLNMNLHLLMESQVATLTDLTRCFYLVQQLKNSCALIDQELFSARV